MYYKQYIRLMKYDYRCSASKMFVVNNVPSFALHRKIIFSFKTRLEKEVWKFVHQVDLKVLCLIFFNLERKVWCCALIVLYLFCVSCMYVYLSTWCLFCLMCCLSMDILSEIKITIMLLFMSKCFDIQNSTGILCALMHEMSPFWTPLHKRFMLSSLWQGMNDIYKNNNLLVRQWHLILTFKTYMLKFLTRCPFIYVINISL